MIPDLVGRVAVVTGGAGGLGLALGRRFAAAGMKVVLADVAEAALDAAEKQLRTEGYDDVIGVVTDVTSYPSVEALRDAALARFGAVHLLCNNAGIGAGAEGPMWEHELGDWGWAVAVNLWGVVHGVKAFVPGMLASGEAGHVVNTSSGNGGIAPLPGTPQYAVTKAAVVTLTECLYGQLDGAGAQLGASVLFPGPHMLRTGLFESWRSRPERFARQRPRTTPHVSVDEMELQLRAAGIGVEWTDPADVADDVVVAVKRGQFWILPPSGHADERIASRAQSMTDRANPTYLRNLPG